MRLLLVPALLGLLLSGCASIGSEDGGPALMTARQALSPADRAALDWADDAALVSLSGSELDDTARALFIDEIEASLDQLREARDNGDVPDEMYESFAQLMGVAKDAMEVDDDDIGDGRSSLWSAGYSSDSQADSYLVVVAHGDVVYERSVSEMMGDEDVEFGDLGDAIGNWSVDSDVASEAASLGDAEYVRLCGETNVMSSLNLAEGDAGPVWYVSVQSFDEEGDTAEDANVAIDASTGSLVRDEVIDVVDVLMQEAGRNGGAFTANAAAHQGYQFDVLREGHLQMAFQVSLFPAPVQPITVTLTDPEGVQTELSVAMGQSPFNAQQSVLLPVVPIGTYQVDIDVPVGLYTNWQATWCTDGTPLDDEDEYSACELLDQSGNNGDGRASPAETLSPIARWLGAWAP